MPNSEILRKTEEKKQKDLAQDLTAPISFDSDKFRKLIALRRAKLETIKALIPLKTYHLIQEKIDAEEKRLEKLIAGKKQQVEIALKQTTGLLTKAFFEIKTLKPKSLRID